MKTEITREKLARDTRDFLAGGGTIDCYDNNGELVERKSFDDSLVSRKAVPGRWVRIIGSRSSAKAYQVKQVWLDSKVGPVVELHGYPRMLAQREREFVA